MPKAIQIWEFSEAPLDYQALTTEWDKEWLAFVPDSLLDRHHFSWLELNAPFGRGHWAEEYTVEGGTVVISAH